jgi:hypothetical protein
VSIGRDSIIVRYFVVVVEVVKFVKMGDGGGLKVSASWYSVMDSVDVMV